MALDFIAGCLGGCAGVIVGHPLDTVKVHLQTQNCCKPIYKGTLDCLKKILVKEGIRGVYKGLSSPLMGVAGINAIVFGIYGNTHRHLNSSSLNSHFVAGATAGLLQSFICSPMELAKSRMQVSSTPSKGPWDCLKKIRETEGFKGVFRGLNMTIAREVPAFGSYFWTYEFLTRNKGTISTWEMLTAGGLAGIVSWVVIYPIDVVKSRMQIDGRYVNSLDCLKTSLASEGYQFLFKGLSPTILRAFPVNAATFAVVTWTIRLLEERDEMWENGILWEKCPKFIVKLSQSVPI